MSDLIFFFFFSSRRRHTRSDRDWSSDVCSSDLDSRVESRPCASPITTSAIVNMDENLKRGGRDRRQIRRQANPPSRTEPLAELSLRVLPGVCRGDEPAQARCRNRPANLTAVLALGAANPTAPLERGQRARQRRALDPQEFAECS